MSSVHSGPIRGKRILLVEDDRGARESVGLLLRIDRHIVTQAQSGKEALELFSHGKYDLVITDYYMEGMRGNELALAIKSQSPAQPILMISAYTEKLSASEKPVDAILPKPFSIDELRQAIAKLLP